MNLFSLQIGRDRTAAQSRLSTAGEESGRAHLLGRVSSTDPLRHALNKRMLDVKALSQDCLFTMADGAALEASGPTCSPSFRTRWPPSSRSPLAV